jgi:hypothetical protein
MTSECPSSWNDFSKKGIFIKMKETSLKLIAGQPNDLSTHSCILRSAKEPGPQKFGGAGAAT